jgi:hypothetical protein
MQEEDGFFSSFKFISSLEIFTSKYNYDPNTMGIL